MLAHSHGFFKNFQKLQGDLKQQKADLIEKEVRDVVTEYYKQQKGMAVVIINGIEMLVLDGAKGQKQEVDFLIVNYSKQYILNIEVKRTLDHTLVKRKNKPDITVIEKSKEQIQIIRKLIEDWFPHLKGTWKYCSMLYCETRDESVMNCSHCADFIAEGPEELLTKIKLMDEKMPVIPVYLGKKLTTWVFNHSMYLMIRKNHLWSSQQGHKKQIELSWSKEF